MVKYVKTINNTKISVVEGDITEEDTEAIVNAANSYLSHGGGVALAIVRKGGNEIQLESNEIVKRKGPLKVGEAVLTKGYKLRAKYVIHVVGPQWGEGDEENKLEKAITSVLTLAKEHSIKSLSIPAVSCGIFGFPKEKGTKIIVNTILKFLSSNGGVFNEIRLIGIDKEIPELFKKSLENA